MSAAKLMTLDVKCIDEDTPIAVAWQLMQVLGVRHLPVLDGRKLVGIVSDRDLLMRATRQLHGGVSFPDLCAAEVMSFAPASAGPDASATQLAAEMLDRHVDAMPIVSPERELLGLVTSTDLLRALALS